MENTSKILAALAVLSLAAVLVTSTFAQTPISLTIERPRMRDITIRYDYSDGSSIMCNVYRKLTMFHVYEKAGEFSLNSGESYRIDDMKINPIYRDMLFDCTTSEGVRLKMNSVFVIGGYSFSYPIESPVTTTTTTTTIPETCTSCSDQGYIKSCQCGSYGWIHPSDCPEPPKKCQEHGETCNSRHKNCCNGLDCEWKYGNWKCD